MVVSSEQMDGQTRECTALVGESLPKAMGPRDMMRAFGVSEPTFFRNQRMGAYKRLELPARLSPRGKRYSGEKVQKFLNGRQG